MASSSQAAPAPGMDLEGSATPRAWASRLGAGKGRAAWSELHITARQNPSLPVVWACEVTQARCTEARGPALLVALWPCPVDHDGPRSAAKSPLQSRTRMSELRKEQPVNVTLLSPLKSAAFFHLLCGQSLTCAPFLQLNVRLKKLSSEP